MITRLTVDRTMGAALGLIDRKALAWVELLGFEEISAPKFNTRPWTNAHVQGTYGRKLRYAQPEEPSWPF